MMNERVAKLIERSMEPTGVEGIAGSYTELNPEKLVESVVQDCVSEVALMGVTNFENEDISWACRVIIDGIKSKFGV
jgi:hypothetical protein